jgi:hypothetical protein
MRPSGFSIGRLRVLWRGTAAYDQTFHPGVNIIRGENGSGKSTIADFIFYGLGGEYDSWKGAAKNCDEVQIEIRANGATLTVRRAIGSKTTIPSVFFGSMIDAEQHALDGWQLFPLHRSGSQESFSQIVFRAAGIPEAQSDGASNLTMHQILRLAYSDQSTPAGKLFRFESWDTTDIREAVGNLICGLNIYEFYEIQLRLRSLNKDYEEKEKLLSLRFAAIPPGVGSANLDGIEFQLRSLAEQRAKLLQDIENVDQIIEVAEDREFSENRKRAARKLNGKARLIRSIEEKIETLEYELSDLDKYISFLTDLTEKVSQADSSSQAIGSIDFTHCPSCLSELKEHKDDGICHVCGSQKKPEDERSKYLQIKIDFEIQNRESHQLREAKTLEVQQERLDLQREKRLYDGLLTDFSALYDLSSSPRESFLAQCNQKLGRLEQEANYLQRLLEIATEITRLSAEKAALNEMIENLKSRNAALAREGDQRKRKALTLVSSTAVKLLTQDLPRQDEFLDPQTVTLNFRDDAISVDGNMNFAASSNVILKNSAILALFSAATMDEDFYHPRFLLMDNVEDKGMEEKRSHNFQSLIVQASEMARFDHQIIFTTSMMNPVLDLEKFVVGPRYTHENKTLKMPAGF